MNDNNPAKFQVEIADKIAYNFNGLLLLHPVTIGWTSISRGSFIFLQLLVGHGSLLCIKKLEAIVMHATLYPMLQSRIKHKASAAESAAGFQ